MYFLDFKQVKEQLDSLGYLKLFSSLQSEERILVLDYTALTKIGLKTDVENELLVVYNKSNPESLDFYEIHKNTYKNLGYGEQSSIYPGKNLRTGELVALKNADFETEFYHGYKIAHQRLNKYPVFVKSYALGQICHIVEKNNSLEIVCRSSDDLTGSAYLVMERVEFFENGQYGKDIQMLQYIAEHWTAGRIKQFMKQVLDAYEILINEKIIGHDDHDPNLLVDKNHNFRICDFNNLRSHNENADFLWINTISPLWYIFRQAREFKYGWNSKTNLINRQAEKLTEIIQNLKKWIGENEQNLARELMEQKLYHAIDELVQERCIVYCLVQKESAEQALGKSFSDTQAEQAKRDCDQVCDPKITLELEASTDPNNLMNPNNYRSSEQTEPTTTVAESQDAQPAQSFFGIPMAKAEVIKTPLWPTYEVRGPLFLPFWDTSKATGLRANSTTAALAPLYPIHASGVETPSSFGEMTSLATAVYLGCRFLYDSLSLCKRARKAIYNNKTPATKQEQYLDPVKDRVIFNTKFSIMKKSLRALRGDILTKPSYSMAYEHCLCNLRKLSSQFKQGKACRENFVNTFEDILELKRQLTGPENARRQLKTMTLPTREELRRRKNATKVSGF